MNEVLLYLLGGALLWAIGLHGLLVLRHPVRRIMAVNLMGSGVFLIMIALANRVQEAADPLLIALVLTGLVVAVSATALALRLASHDDQGGGGL